MTPAGLFLPKKSACGPRRTSIFSMSIWPTRTAPPRDSWTPSMLTATVCSKVGLDPAVVPTPRRDTVPPTPPDTSPTEIPGVTARRSCRLSTARVRSCSLPSTVTATGTEIGASSRRRAVTTTSSTPVTTSVSGPVCAAAGSANEINAHASAPHEMPVFTSIVFPLPRLRSPRLRAGALRPAPGPRHGATARRC
ncbi:hypothetical protein D3C80_1476950 [compost metagenome]